MLPLGWPHSSKSKLWTLKPKSRREGWEPLGEGIAGREALAASPLQFPIPRASTVLETISTSC